jgi:predicted phosphate transport protein (TIGR00153 family)
MLSWFQAIMPKEDRFFGLYQQHAQTLVLGAKALRELLEGGQNVQACCARIFQHEDEADAIARDGILLVRQTFITPFDRIDIQNLFSSLDDSIDQMKKTAKAITLFETDDFEPQMREMADIIVQCADLTTEMVALLPKMRLNAGKLIALAERIVKLEDDSDHVCDAGLKALYLKHRDGNAMGYIVGAEIYDHLEKVVDRFEDVANGITGILIEHL